MSDLYSVIGTSNYTNLLADPQGADVEGGFGVVGKVADEDVAEFAALVAGQRQQHRILESRHPLP